MGKSRLGTLRGPMLGPSTHTGQFPAACKDSSRASVPFPDLHRRVHTGGLHSCPHLHTIKNKSKILESGTGYGRRTTYCFRPGSTALRVNFERVFWKLKISYQRGAMVGSSGGL